jgi:hypothetical protein
MATFLSALIATLFISRGKSAPIPELNNITISGPGISNHDKSNLVCFPTKATDILLFFLANYLAHATTVKTRPGASGRETALCILDSLLYPVDGITIALDSIFRWS